jgi:hypothetical protein
MNLSQDADRPIKVETDQIYLHVTLKDGRVISTPLAWYLRLQNASREQLAHVELNLTGIHWPEIDEDLSVQGMLKGMRPPLPRPEKEQN